MVRRAAVAERGGWGAAASPGGDEAVRRGGWGAASVAGGAGGEDADGGRR
jgi:hypothetical protein